MFGFTESMQLRFRHSARWTRELAPSDRRIWLLWAIGWQVEVRRDPVWDFVIYWKRLAAVCAVMLVGGYVSAVSALHWWWGRQPEARVRWVDIALAPIQWDNFRRARGEVAIAVGLKQLERGDANGAYFNLRAGLGRMPDHVPARVVLANLLLARPAEAVRVLDAGLALRPNEPAFLRALFRVYETSDAGTVALARADEFLKSDRKPALTPEARYIVQLARATFLARGNRNEAALQALPSDAADANPADREQAARWRSNLLSRVGRPEEARAELEAWRKWTKTPEATWEVELTIAVDAADEAGVKRAVRQLKVARPNETYPLLAEFEAWSKLKRPTLRAGVEKEFLNLYSGNDRALQELALLAARQGLPEVIVRLQAVAMSRGLSPFAYDVDLTEEALRRHDFSEALRLLKKWEDRLSVLEVSQRAVPGMIARLTRACAQEEADQESSLPTYLEKNPILLVPLRGQWLVECLEAAGRHQVANAVLTLALARYPLSDTLKEQNVRVSLILAREKPTTDSHGATAATAASVPATSAEAFLILDQAIAASDFGGFAEKLRQWKQARPQWLESADKELEIRELQVALLTRDPWVARLTVRNYLERNRRGEAAVRLVELAMSLKVAGKTAEADIVHDEVAEMRGSIPAVAEALAKLSSGDATAAAFTNAPAALALIDQALARHDPENALWLIERVRRTAPDWLKEIELDLATREIRGRLDAEQRVLAYGLLRDLAVKPGLRRAAAFRLVREYIAEGKAATALALAKEIERLVPGEQAVSVLVREAEVAQPTKP